MKNRVSGNPHAFPLSGELQPGNTALLVIDMQHDFCSEGGYMHRLGERPAGTDRAHSECARSGAHCRLSCDAHARGLQLRSLGSATLEAGWRPERRHRNRRRRPYGPRAHPGRAGLGDYPRACACARRVQRTRNISARSRRLSLYRSRQSTTSAITSLGYCVRFNRPPLRSLNCLAQSSGTGDSPARCAQAAP